MILREIPREGGTSPWGVIQSVRVVVEHELYFASTSSHGGYWVGTRLLNLLPEVARETPYSKGGWFEEDCDAAIPYAFLPADLIGNPEAGSIERARATILSPHFHMPEVKQALEQVIANEWSEG